MVMVMVVTDDRLRWWSVQCWFGHLFGCASTGIVTDRELLVVEPDGGRWR